MMSQYLDESKIPNYSQFMSSTRIGESEKNNMADRLLGKDPRITIEPQDLVKNLKSTKVMLTHENSKLIQKVKSLQVQNSRLDI